MTTVRTLTDVDIPAPSALPGWTRGHVLTHVARTADGLGNLPRWAETGVKQPMPASRRAREADIERDAAAPISAHLTDLAASAGQLARQVQALPPAAWARESAVLTGRTPQARDIPAHQVREVRIHHVDLLTGFTAADWPAGFVQPTIEVIIADLGRRADLPPLLLPATDTGEEYRLSTGPPTEVMGDSHIVLAWLIGHPGSATPAARPGHPLPRLPPWI